MFIVLLKHNHRDVVAITDCELPFGEDTSNIAILGNTKILKLHDLLKFPDWCFYTNITKS